MKFTMGKRSVVICHEILRLIVYNNINASNHFETQCLFGKRIYQAHNSQKKLIFFSQPVVSYNDFSFLFCLQPTEFRIDVEIKLINK